MIRKLIFLLFLLGAFSCKKEDPRGDPEKADTLYPKSYLPIYPGSYWTYFKTSNSTLVTMTAGSYSLQSAAYNDHHSKYYWVPSWNGVPHFGYGYITTFHYETAPDKDQMTYELKEESGHNWYVEYTETDPRWNYGNLLRSVDSIGISKTIGSSTFNNVIKTEDYTYSGMYRGSAYYAKDIGLIEKITYDPVTFVHDTLLLQNYFINH